MLLADRPTTSRWTPSPRGERSYQVRPTLEGKNRGRHFVRKTPLAGSQIAFESDPGSAFEPNASPRPRRQPQFNTGIAFLLSHGSRHTIALATFELRPHSG